MTNAVHSGAVVPALASERAEPDRRPEAQAAEQQRGHRDAGGSPDGRDLFGDERELKADCRRDDVSGNHRGARHEPTHSADDCNPAATIDSETPTAEAWLPRD